MSRTTKLKSTDLKNKVDTAITTILGGVASRIKEYRLKKGITVRELGKLSNVSYTVIYDIENNRSLPKFETLIRIAIALDVPIESILKESSISLTTVEDRKESIRKILLKEGLKDKDIKDVTTFITFKKLESEGKLK